MNVYETLNNKFEMIMDRRTFLQLSALGLTLPTQLFAAMDAKKSLVKLKKNLVLVGMDLGLYEKFFREGGVNSHYMEKYFYDFKGKRTYFNGIYEPDMGGGHECHAATFTALKFEDRARYPQRPFISLDQRVAEGCIQETRNKLIYHQVAGGDPMSWNKFAQPMPAIKGLDNLHSQIFERQDEAKARASIRRERDILIQLNKNLKRRWKGTPEQVNLRASVAYQIESLEEKEKWLKLKKPYLKKAFDSGAQNTPLPSCHHNFRLIYDALEKKQTKIAMIQFGGGSIVRGLGVERGHHGNSHHGNYPERIAALNKIDGGVLGGLKGFLELLEQGGLMDDTIVLFHCAMADASRHNNKNAPAFLFGGGFKHQEQLDCQDSNQKVLHSTSSLFSSVLKQCGFSDHSFSGNQKVIGELF